MSGRILTRKIIFYCGAVLTASECLNIWIFTYLFLFSDVVFSSFSFMPVLCSIGLIVFGLYLMSDPDDKKKAGLCFILDIVCVAGELLYHLSTVRIIGVIQFACLAFILYISYLQKRAIANVTPKKSKAQSQVL